MFQVFDKKIEYVENGDVLGVLEFEYLDSDTVSITRTFVKEEYRGRGIAKKLVEYAFDYFKNQSVTYTCSYVKNYKEGHNEN